VPDGVHRRDTRRADDVPGGARRLRHELRDAGIGHAIVRRRVQCRR
jgi:hypothetical protein